MAGKTLDNIPPFTPVLTSNDVYDAERNPKGTLVDRKALAGFASFIVLDDTVLVERQESTGKVRLLADFDGVLKPAKITKVTSVFSGKENEITANGQIVVEGENLIWDDSQPDEGFFLNYMGIEVNMELVEQDSDGRRVVVKDQRRLPMSPGDPLELWLYVGRQVPHNDGSHTRCVSTVPGPELTVIEGEDDGATE